MPAAISLLNVIPDDKKNIFTKIIFKLLDRILAINKLDGLYRENKLHGLDKTSFAKSLLEGLNIQLLGLKELQAKIPKTGPVVIASNHPFGGIEGVFLAWAIEQVRPDIKVMANQGLKIFPELEDYFIFTNPLSEGDPKNAPSIRTCLKHVKTGGALLIFPAGRVSYFHKDTQRIADHSWNRLIASIANRANAHYLPIFVSGLNSPLFYRLGRIYFRFRILMLPRELVNKRNAKITVTAGEAIAIKHYAKGIDTGKQTELFRAQSYLLDPLWQKPWPADPVTELQPLVAEVSGDTILQEVQQLPDEQHLLDHKGLSVYFGYQSQLPNTVKEIARLRELVFREHNEGSGEPLDTDHFDATYTHLFVMKTHSGQIIGAYRMGQTDKLLADGNLENLYLHRMFNFGPDFVNRNQPCLEMGRSFLIPEYQRSFQGLFLLWRGIGAFVCLYPHYRTLYGTVSISKLYDVRSAAIIQQAMVTATNKVEPRAPFEHKLHPEVQDFARQHGLKEHVTALLQGIEPDGKDVPILLKHYNKLGAVFHCLGIDKNFNDTPGLLLSVDLPEAPEKLLKLYLGESWQEYKKTKSSK
ncbi:lysophospholipid acyltransferase family protein [uncultured Paraglaciecola sp.]|uniref:lysophospholipid acyltransferase family protein n=1 Tax=uncultured Paraglaciecola sp. TaxID=1765024 RepID=UPI0030D90CD4|tara:strand:+ start:14058 stop:15806 length:1749 start_codon:yes stop_codon:yes gene_type:complete